MLLPASVKMMTMAFPFVANYRLKVKRYFCIAKLYRACIATFSHRKRDRKAVPDSVLHILSACLYEFGWLGCFLVRILDEKSDTTVSDTTLSYGKFLYRECHEHRVIVAR
jgi:hypothetical protein